MENRLRTTEPITSLFNALRLIYHITLWSELFANTYGLPPLSNANASV